MEVPITMTIRRGSTTVAAGTALCASMIAAATGVPGASPRRAAAASVRPPTRRPGGVISPPSFSASVGEARIERGEKLARREPALARSRIPCSPRRTSCARSTPESS